MALMNLAQSFRVTNRPGGCFATIYGVSFEFERIGNDSFTYGMYTGSNCSDGGTLLYYLSGTDGECGIGNSGLPFFTNISFEEQQIDVSVLDNNPSIDCNYGVLNYGVAIGLIPENVCVVHGNGVQSIPFNGNTIMMICDYSNGSPQAFLLEYMS